MVKQGIIRLWGPVWASTLMFCFVVSPPAFPATLGITVPGTPIPPEGGLRIIGSADNFPSDEDYVRCVVMDRQKGYGWFGTSTIPGQVIKVAFGDGGDPPRRVGSVTLQPGEDNLFTGVIDATAGYAYFGAFTTPGKIIKIALGEGDEPPSRVGSMTLDPSESPLFSSVIDPAAGYAWFGTRTGPGRVVKVSLGAGNALPSRVGSVTLDFLEANLRCAAIDPAAGYAWFGTFTDPGRVVKVALGAGASPPERVGGIALVPGEERGLATALVDPAQGYAWFGTYSSPGPSRVVKVALGAGNDPPVRLGSTAMAPGEDGLVCAVMNSAYPREALFGCDTFPGQVVKVSLGDGPDLPVRIGADVLETGEDGPVCAAGIVQGGVLFGMNTSPGQIVKVAFGTSGLPPTRLNVITLPRGESELQSAVIDPQRGYAWFGTARFPGQVVKVSLGKPGKPPRRVSSVALDIGEDRLTSAIIDPVVGYAWFGTDTNPGKVVKIALGDGDNPPQKVGTLTLNADEPNLRSAVIDRANGFGYFGTATRPPGKVVKVNLGAGNAPPTRVGATIPQVDEWDFQCAVIDPARGYALFGTGLYFFDMFQPARVVKVALGVGANPPQRIAGIPQGTSEDILLSALYDPASGFGWFGQGHSGQTSIIKVQMGEGNATPTRTNAGQLQNGESPLPAAVSDLESGYGLFGAGSFPGKVIKVSLGQGASVPVRTGSLGVDGIHAAAIDTASGVAFFGTSVLTGNVIKVSYSQKGYIKGSRVVLSESATAESVHFYSHQAAGDLRLAIYQDGGGGKNLVWQSGVLSNPFNDNWHTIPVSSGIPSGLILSPGIYWLTYQTSSAADVAGYVAGATGDGFLMPNSFSVFPETIPDASLTLTSETWSEYLSYTPTSEISGWRVY